MGTSTFSPIMRNWALSPWAALGRVDIGAIVFGGFTVLPSLLLGDTPSGHERVYSGRARWLRGPLILYIDPCAPCPCCLAVWTFFVFPSCCSGLSLPPFLGGRGGWRSTVHTSRPYGRGDRAQRIEKSIPPRQVAGGPGWRSDRAAPEVVAKSSWPQGREFAHLPAFFFFRLSDDVDHHQGNTAIADELIRCAGIT